MTEILVKIGAVLALLAALFFAEQYIEGRGYDRARAEDQVAANKLKAEAAAALATETAKVYQAEHALQAATDSQNLKDQDHEKTVADLSNRLHRAAGPAGRLRDPHAALGCGPSGGGAPAQVAGNATDRSDDAAQAGGLLSAELTGLLQRLQSEADTINVAYASCRTDAYTVRTQQ